MTTHCAGELQKILAGEGQKQYQEENGFITEITIKLMQEEWKKLEDLTRTPNAQGYGEGFASPGFAI
jgi:hypothetical protein